MCIQPSLVFGKTVQQSKEKGMQKCGDGGGYCGDGFGFVEMDLDLWMFWVCCNSRGDADAEVDASPVRLFSLHENQQEMQVAHGKRTLTSS